MNCIDGIEGVAKKVVEELFRAAKTQGYDDTECIRNVRAVIEATDIFVKENPEVVSDPSLLFRELYRYAKNLWLTVLHQPEEVPKELDEEYYGYYFDRIYHQEVYPL